MFLSLIVIFLPEFSGGPCGQKVLTRFLEVLIKGYNADYIC